jgi:hypothetical protein
MSVIANGAKQSRGETIFNLAKFRLRVVSGIDLGAINRFDSGSEPQLAESRRHCCTHHGPRKSFGGRDHRFTGDASASLRLRTVGGAGAHARPRACRDAALI